MLERNWKRVVLVDNIEEESRSTPTVGKHDDERVVLAKLETKPSQKWTDAVNKLIFGTIGWGCTTSSFSLSVDN